MANNTLNTSAGYVQTISSTWAGQTAHASAKFMVDETGVVIYPRPRWVSLTPSIDTSAITVNDVLADTEILAACCSGNDIPCYLIGVTLLDKSHTSAGHDLWLLRDNVTLGTENAAVSISDTNAEQVIDYVQFNLGDKKDLVNSYFWAVTGLRIPIRPKSGTDDIYVALKLNEVSTTADYSTGDIVMNFIFSDV